MQTTKGSAEPFRLALALNGAEQGNELPVGRTVALSPANFAVRVPVRGMMTPRLRFAPGSGARVACGLRLAALALFLVAGPLGAQQPWPQQAPYGPPQGAQYPQAYPQPQQGYPQPGYGAQPPYSQQGYADPSAGQIADNGADPGQDPGQAPAPIQPQAPLNVQQLEQLVAPIALYPDTLVAQILAAATYPAQVVDADHWRQSQGYASPDQVVYGANAQSWDPSLKALTAFPQVLSEMDQNIRWTIALGNAYYNQPQDVLDVVQVMRQRAQAAGNLASGPQEQVSYDQGYIQVAPANPDLVYLPAYDPWSAYGQPIQPYQGFSLLGTLGSFFNSGFGSGLVRFGSGIATSAFSHSPFGLLSWGLNWLTHSLLFHNSNYYSHSTSVADWGLPRGGQRYFGPRGYAHGPDRAYDRSVATARPPANGNRYAGAGSRPQQPYGRPETASNYRPGTPIRAGGHALRPGFSGYEGRTNPAPTPRPAMEAYNRQPGSFAGQSTARPMGNSYVRSAAPYGYASERHQPRRIHRRLFSSP